MSLQKMSLVSAFFISVVNNAEASVKYHLTLTNGGQMPFSPAVIYVRNGQAKDLSIGSQPSLGFVKLCQTGNPVDRAKELKTDKAVYALTTSSAPILPGESKDIVIEVSNSAKQSIHIEAMYGKTKDVCAVGYIGGHNLYAVESKVFSDYFAKDSVVGSGAFLEPVVTTSAACSSAKDAVSCLRELAAPNTEKQALHFFSAYLPSVLDFLETKYGANEVQPLLIPSAGALQIRLQLKH